MEFPLPSLKFQMRLTPNDLVATAAIAAALNTRSGSPFTNRASAMRHSFTLVARLIDCGLLDQVEALLTSSGPEVTMGSR